MTYNDRGGYRDGNRERGEGGREGFRPRRDFGSQTSRLPEGYKDARMSADDREHRPRFRRSVGGNTARPRFIGVEQNGGAQRPVYSQGMRQTDRQGEHRQYSQSERPHYSQSEHPHYSQSERPQRKFNNPDLYSKKKRFEYEEKYEDPTKPIRLNKYLANAGICSRREADDFIMAGVITVNGEVVSELGAKVLPTDKVMFHNQPVRREKKVYILLNKPKNTVTTTDDPQERHTVIDIVKDACSERVYPVGRLDRNTTGVLLLTNDGDLASKLTHPKFEKKKVYAATLDKDLTEEAYQEIMSGIVLDDEVIIPDALEFPHDDDRRHIGLQIHSGQNRVVRRIFEKVGYKVVQLDRVSFAGLTKKNLPRGKYRFLTQQEVNFLLMGNF